MSSSKCEDETAVKPSDISLGERSLRELSQSPLNGFSLNETEKDTGSMGYNLVKQSPQQQLENTLDAQAYHEISLTLPSRLNIAEKIAEQRAQVVDVASLPNLGPLITYTSFQSKSPFQVGSKHLRQLLHKGAAVQGRVGSRWYPGKIHAVNEDGSIDVCFDDNDFRPCVPSDRIKVCLGDGSWVLAFDVLKHSTTEMQELRVLHRKSKKYLRRLGLNLQAGLQSLYAEHLVLKLLSTVELQSINRVSTSKDVTTTNAGDDSNASLTSGGGELDTWCNSLLSNHKLLLMFLRQASLRPVSLNSTLEQMSPNQSHTDKEILVAPLLSPGCGVIHVTETALDFLRTKILKSLEIEKKNLDNLKDKANIATSVNGNLLEVLISEIVAHFVLLSSCKKGLKEKESAKTDAKLDGIGNQYMFKEVLNARALRLLASEDDSASDNNVAVSDNNENFIPTPLIDNVSNHPDIISGGDDNATKILNKMNLKLSIWALDIVIEFLERQLMDNDNDDDNAIGSTKSDKYLTPDWISFIDRNIFSPKIIGLLVKTVENANEDSITHLLSLLTRYICVASTQGFVVDHETGKNKFDTTIFSILGRAFAQRYQKEQLTMTKVQSSGVPLYSVYCQNLAELMVAIKRVGEVLDANTDTQMNIAEAARKERMLLALQERERKIKKRGLARIKKRDEGSGIKDGSRGEGQMQSETADTTGASSKV
jgi:hypothetical protein